MESPRDPFHPGKTPLPGNNNIGTPISGNIEGILSINVRLLKPGREVDAGLSDCRRRTINVAANS